MIQEAKGTHGETDRSSSFLPITSKERLSKRCAAFILFYLLRKTIQIGSCFGVGGRREGEAERGREGGEGGGSSSAAKRREHSFEPPPPFPSLRYKLSLPSLARHPSQCTRLVLFHHFTPPSSSHASFCLGERWVAANPLRRKILTMSAAWKWPRQMQLR